MLNLRLKDARPNASSITVDVEKSDLEALKTIINAGAIEATVKGLVPRRYAHANAAEGDQVLIKIENGIDALIKS